MLDPNSKLLCHYDDAAEALDEHRRTKAISELGLMDIESVPVFEEATQTAAHLLNAPICILGLMEPDRQLFKSAFGLCRIGLMNELATSRQLPRNEAFCSQVFDTQQVLTLSDTRLDERFANSRLVQRYGIQAYAGVPIFTSSGYCIGTLAVMDLSPRQFTSRELEMLELVARWCMSEYERSYLRKQTIAEKMAVSAPAPLTSNISAIKGTLLSHMAQELRTPLTSILGMASVLNREIYGPLTDKQKEYMDIIHNSGQYLLSVLNEMLELGALEEKNASLNLSTVDIEMLCQQSLTALQQAAQRQEQQLRLTMGLGPSDRIWLLDKDKIRQMLYHLVLSVIQAASPDSDIRVHVSRRDNHLTLAISVYHPWLGDGLPHADYLLRQLMESTPGSTWDNGANYPELASENIDEESPLAEVQRAKKIATVSRQSLELNLCKQLIELHGGDIKLQGTPESGYRYLVTIPQLSE
ncbi:MULTISPECIES: GAF domain-containing sensor histidine kinase [unclassified Leptolyngbya]|uniref:GAF domain-containing sensor histidine kinase n=1 Tax=unclassified Leptolyngbya TaxID=2650499 RepID=UPI0016895AAC|nr:MULTISPECIES: GAF domain-containing sensor histidine kinase [unclassified Leptolyngbya]MBD1911212.1 GAF domain-containing sensor histidine kinase [Leptolyngbya sp. FACHB-8]MBD2155459.1 GAF domain-containing sensor histidine kinase [Leptolyngbya sp. FACHB-16]